MSEVNATIPPGADYVEISNIDNPQSIEYGLIKELPAQDEGTTNRLNVTLRGKGGESSGTICIIYTAGPDDGPDCEYCTAVSGYETISVESPIPEFGGTGHFVMIQPDAGTTQVDQVTLTASSLFGVRPNL